MNIDTYVKNPNTGDWGELLKRPELNEQDLMCLCGDIFTRVEKDKDIALLDYTQRFDGVELKSIYATKEELTIGASLVPRNLAEAMDVAYANITKFHEAQVPKKMEVETMKGVVCSQVYRGIERAGLYIPGGSAPLFSTVLMLGIPAQIAGCKEIILCTPPDKDGQISPAICYAAQQCGIEIVLKLGGVQAIAALAKGTNRTHAVSKIFGPGNQYVMAAKQYAQNLGIAIDLPAGPSEVLIIADSTANAKYVATDLLSQAEHGPDSQVILLSTDKNLFDKVRVELITFIKRLSRKDVILQALDNSRFVYFTDLKTCFEFSNAYAPEHLILALGDAEAYVDRVVNAGSVFLGNYSPESAGDYASGTNHTLPTKGYAKSYSGVGVLTFMKKITFQKIDKSGITKLAPIIVDMANAEGLEAHALAASIRMEGGLE